jgi:integrase
MYSPPVAGMMLGFHLPDPAPPDQCGVLDSYRQPLDWNKVMRSSVAPRASQRRKPGFQAAASSSPSPEGVGHEAKLPESLIQLRKIVIAYSRADKAAARAVRKRVLQALRHFQQEMEARLGKSEAESWSKLLSRLDRPTLAIEQIDAFDGAVLAAWLASMIRSKPPNTVEARLNDVTKLARSMLGRLVFQLEESALFGAIAAWPLSQSSRARLADSLQGLYRFVASTLEMSVPVIAWWRHKQRIICERRVLSQFDLERLLIELRGMGCAGSLAIISVLLSYYFGLRASEICHVRLGDLWLEGTPTVFVWRSKGGHSRFVEGIELPQAVIQVLRQFQQRRLQQASGLRSAKRS